jgi:hypothetical protein
MVGQSRSVFGALPEGANLSLNRKRQPITALS